MSQIDDTTVDKIAEMNAIYEIEEKPYNQEKNIDLFLQKNNVETSKNKRKYNLELQLLSCCF